MVEEKIKTESQDDLVKPDEKNAPKDKLYMVHILFFLMGLLHFMPYSYFTCAIQYWMYKFRDVNNSNWTESETRTVLQRQFAASTQISSSIPSVLFLGLTTVYGNLLKVKVRMYGSLFTLLGTFVIFTAFININTDSWQLEYYILTMLTIAVITIANSILGITLFALISKFPKTYLNTYLNGNTFAGIFNSLLQVTSLALGTDINISALIYFITGTGIILITLIFYMISQNLPFYKYYMGNFLDEKVAKKAKPVNLKEMWTVTKLTWVSNVIFILITLTGLINPSITALVQSEYKGQNEWGDKYFVPICTFLFFDLGDLIGRALTYIPIKLNGILLTIINVIRLFVIPPLMMLCNAYPRNHLPVVFPHDYQYIIIMLSYSITAGYFFNIAYLLIQRTIEPDKVELAYSILTTYYGIVSAVFSVGSYFLVYLL